VSVFNPLRSACRVRVVSVLARSRALLLLSLGHVRTRQPSRTSLASLLQNGTADPPALCKTFASVDLQISQPGELPRPVPIDTGVIAISRSNPCSCFHCPRRGTSGSEAPPFVRRPVRTVADVLHDSGFPRLRPLSLHRQSSSSRDPLVSIDSRPSSRSLLSGHRIGHIAPPSLISPRASPRSRFRRPRNSTHATDSSGFRPSPLPSAPLVLPSLSGLKLGHGEQEREPPVSLFLLCSLSLTA
jgi:hypothetical protein